MSRASSKINPILSKFITIFISAVSLCNAIPLEAAAASKPFQMRRRQINAFVNRNGLEKVALNGVMPATASVVVKPVSTTAESTLCSYDITILNGKTEYQPSETYPITVEISDQKISDAVEQDRDLLVWHIRDDGTREQIFDFTVKDDTISFDAFGFSIYEVDTEKLGTYEFYYPTGTNTYEKYYFPLTSDQSGSKDYRQILKDGDMLTVPQLPASTEKTTFIGWFEGGDSGPTADTSFDFSERVSISADKTVKLYAVFADCAYVIFHDQYSSEKETWPVIATRRGELQSGKAMIKTDDLTVTYDGGISSGEQQNSIPHMVFRGWSTTPKTTAGDGADLVGAEVEIEDNLNLYPIFSEIRWLSFDTTGGNYIAPQYYDIGTEVSELPTPKRTGYTFDGWYTDAECTDVNKVTSLTISDDTTLYAKWKEAQAQYAIAIWKQRITDDYTATEKEYDFVKSIVQTANTNATVSVPNKYTNYTHQKDTDIGEDFTGFYYNASKSNTRGQVAGDGSTVLNIYYDRDKFVYTWDSKYKGDSTPTLTGLYAQPITMYGYVWPSGGTSHGVYKYADIDTYITLLPYFNDVPNATYDNDNHTYTIHFQANNAYAGATIYHHLQKLDGTYSSSSEYSFSTNASSPGYFNLSDKFGPAFSVVGYNPNKQYDGKWTVSAKPGDQYYFAGDFHVYHERNSYYINFVDSNSSSTVYGTESYLYEEPLANAGSSIQTPSAPEGYRFTGWYKDDKCTQLYDFSTSIMPPQSFAVYAGWEKVTYLVELDPNGGVLQKDQRTWYEVEHGGDPIPEYSTTTRNYVPAQDGEYYYYYAEYPTEHDETNGDAYYTTDISSGANLSVSYKYEPNSYRYSQWYEVHEDGTETPYKFGEPVLHDTKLRLHWKELTTYHIRYDAGKGTLDNGNKSESDFQTLDKSEYADHASVVVTRTAIPPAASNFIGWQIRGDKSGTVYYPGQSFDFSSVYAKTETVDGKPQKVIILDAVYQGINTAKIIYDANGGMVAADADLGGPTDTDLPDELQPTKTYTSASATIGNLVNNSGIQLASGDGFEYGDYTFKGWNTKPDGSGDHFDAKAVAMVDTDEPVTLYAEWEVKVYFDKNNEKCTWDEAWETTDGYTFDSEKGLYYTTVLLNSKLDEPNIPMESSNPEELFWYWGTSRYKEDSERYDFSQPVTSEMTLYGYWDKLAVPIHVIDSSKEELVQVDDWRKTEEIKINSSTNIALDAKHGNYVDYPDDYKYAFACIGKVVDGKPQIFEENRITNISYNSANRCVWVTYKDGTEGALPSDCELYFVYFESPEKLPIGYVELGNDGELKTVTVNTSGQNIAPTKTDSDPYIMNNKLKTPLSYPTKNPAYQNYSYAIGDPNAADATGLHIITSVKTDNNNRPTLQFQKTWRGYQYSTDGGKTWTNCGYNIQPYVVYYPSKPVIITLDEKTIGLAEDMDEKFTYTVKVEQITKTTTIKQTKNKQGKWNDDKNGTTTETVTTDVFESSIDLADGEKQSYTLFRSSVTEDKTTEVDKNGNASKRNHITTEITQRITIVQTEKDDFETDNNGGTNRKDNLTYTYTTVSNSTDQKVTFTNTHTPVPVELHIALLQNGGYVKTDSLRTNNAGTYIQNIALNGQFEPSKTNPSGLFTGNAADYEFLGIIYGTVGENGKITPSVNEVTKVTYDKVKGDQIYDVCINGDKEIPIGDGQIFYVYYAKPKIVYVKETPDGLELINPIQSQESSVSLNGKTVSQWDYLTVGDGLIFSQDGSGFKVPPKLDGINPNSLIYSRIGVGSPDSNSISLTDFSTDKYMEMRINNGFVEYRYSAGGEWKPFEEAPVVYVVYKEFGYDLHITKKIVGQDTEREFTLTIRSEQMDDQANYMIKGVPNIKTIQPNNKTIELTITDGSDITISGLPEGSYTLTETASRGTFTLTALVDGHEETVTDNAIQIYLDEDKSAELINTLPDIPLTGYAEKAIPFGAMLAMLLTFWILRRRSYKKGVRCDAASPI